jgi:hypothetical protein
MGRKRNLKRYKKQTFLFPCFRPQGSHGQSGHARGPCPRAHAAQAAVRLRPSSRVHRRAAPSRAEQQAPPRRVSLVSPSSPSNRPFRPRTPRNPPTSRRFRSSSSRPSHWPHSSLSRSHGISPALPVARTTMADVAPLLGALAESAQRMNPPHPTHSHGAALLQEPSAASLLCPRAPWPVRPCSSPHLAIFPHWKEVEEGYKEDIIAAPPRRCNLASAHIMWPVCSLAPWLPRVAIRFAHHVEFAIALLLAPSSSHHRAGSHAAFVSPSGRRPSSQSEHRLHISNLVSPCRTF